MAVSYVQSASDASGVNVASLTPTLGVAATAGNLLVLYYASGDNGTYPTAPAPSGFTNTLATALTNGGVPSRYSRIYHKIAAGGETSVSVTPSASYTGFACLVEYDIDGGTIAAYGAVARTGGSGGSFSGAWTDFGGTGLSPTAGSTVLLGYGGADSIAGGELLPPGSTQREIGVCSIGEGAAYADIIVTSASPPYAPTFSDNNMFYANVAAYWELAPTDPPVADFTSNVTDILEGETVDFTDLSTETPTSWSWDFGDGGTSTSQNPSHTFTVAGTYTVSLTATNAFGSDTETKTGYIDVAADVGFEDPAPGAALIEIYAAEIGSARWDQAEWDEAVWSTAGWQDVTPESVQAVVVWGSSQPELGILSRPSAGSWSIDTYDPDRLLDPANADSPYFGDLEPGLPIRITHRGVVIRQGIVESMSFGFADDRGFIRVQDNIAPLANAMVPDDVDLGDTLYARARAAISAAGLAVTVLPDPASGDPALVPWVTGTSRSAWQWIQDAAEQVLHIPYIDRIGRLGFRAWASPLARARDLTATELIDLVSLVQYDGLYSVVTALDDDGVTIVQRASTPPPRYGARTYVRNSATPNVEDWLEAVLADRVSSGRRWLPGTVYPLTADSVEKYATLEAVELLSLSHLFTTPPVAADVIIVGGRITITAKQNEEAEWRFDFEASETPTTPLITEAAAGFVLSEDGSVFLYPE